MKNYKYKLVVTDHTIYDEIDDTFIRGDVVLGRFNSLKKLFESFNHDLESNNEKGLYNIFDGSIKLYRYGRKNKYNIRPKKLMTKEDKIKTLIREGFTEEYIKELTFFTDLFEDFNNNEFSLI